MDLRGLRGSSNIEDRRGTSWGRGGGFGGLGGLGGLGGGFGLMAKPLGVFVIKDGTVRWRPAIDVNKVILGGQIVAVTALLVVRAFIKARRPRRR